MAGSSTESVVQTVRLGLAALRDSAAASDDVRRSGGGGDAAQTMSGRQVKTAVSESVERVHLRATSVGMFWGGETTPSAAEASSLLQQYEQDMLQFFAVCHGAASGAGPTLRRSLFDGAASVAGATTELLSALEGTSRRGDVKKLTGLVWQACNAAKRMAPDNKTALCKRLAQVATGLKDAFKEVTEMLSDQAEGGEGGLEGLGDSEEDDLDFEADELSDKELAVARAGLAAMNALMDGIKAILKAWLTASEFPEGGDEICSLEAALEELIQAGTAAEGLAASLYGPQDGREVRGAVDGMSRGWGEAMSRLEASPLFRRSFDRELDTKTVSALVAVIAELDR